jgi:DNA-binding beta-propeller fold protein YncE
MTTDMKSVQRRFLNPAAVLIAVLLQGCPSLQLDLPDISKSATPGRRASPQLARSWPQAPALARIRFVRAFASAKDIGIGRSVLESLANLVLGAEPRQLVRPTAVVADDGKIFVADAGVQGVHVFDRRNDEYRVVRREHDQPIVTPMGLVNAPDGTLFITDSTRAEILQLAPGASFARPLHLDYAPGRPTGLAMQVQTGHLLVTDTAHHRIDVVSSAGHRIRSIGQRGNTTGSFNYPTHLWQHPDGQLVVADSLNYRIQMMDPDGMFHTVWGKRGDGTGDFASLKGIATDSDGHVYVVDALFNAVQIFEADGRYLLSFGQFGQGPGDFWLPAGIFIDAHDQVYVADAYNGRIQVFEYLRGAQ